jgi:plasmid maintenance system antidote protein VapI
MLASYTQLCFAPRLLTAQDSGDMALRIEKAFGVKMDTIIGMQSAY